MIAVIHPDNERSRRLARRCGMRVERRLSNPWLGAEVEVWSSPSVEGAASVQVPPRAVWAPRRPGGTLAVVMTREAPVRPGHVFHVPGGARHAWRNPSLEPAVPIIVPTGKLGRFFREVANLLASADSPGEELRRFLETADRCGYWNATPHENEQVGLYL